MFSIGRVCFKIAGRDSNCKCVIVDVFDSNYVLIDGQTRRRKCNIDHLEPLPQTVAVDKNASHDAAVKALQAIGVVCDEKKAAKAGKTKKPLQKRRSVVKHKQNSPDRQSGQ
ncbi:50S ribosomal protein L14e [Candidatus Woesearchaeota archaeon]|nr:50S ribosomal protein L14e [Candidatus Woesearchaeota archaeon]